MIVQIFNELFGYDFLAVGIKIIITLGKLSELCYDRCRS